MVCGYGKLGHGLLVYELQVSWTAGLQVLVSVAAVQVLVNVVVLQVFALRYVVLSWCVCMQAGPMREV